MTGLSSKTNERKLARIRDNQRRSRARRKEYLQDLERKYRKCQEEGIEAAVEIQEAAKRVVEENVRLRNMLTSRGISWRNTEKYSVDGVKAADLTAVSDLQRVMQPRKPPQPQTSSLGVGMEQEAPLQQVPCAAAQYPQPMMPIEPAHYGLSDSVPEDVAISSAQMALHGQQSGTGWSMLDEGNFYSVCPNYGHDPEVVSSCGPDSSRTTEAYLGLTEPMQHDYGFSISFNPFLLSS